MVGIGIGLGVRNRLSSPAVEPIIPFNTRTIGEGDSLFSYVDGRSILQWLNIFLDGRLKWSPNGVAATDANAGHEWALIDGTVATLITEHAPLGLVLADGGTNDTDVTVPITDAIADAEHFVDTLNASDAWVFYMEIPPRADVNAADKLADQNLINSTIRGWQTTKDLKSFNVASAWNTALTSDGVHQLTGTAYAVARYLADAMAGLIEAGDVRSVLGANLLTNANFATGTGGTIASGMAGGSTIPLGWTVDNDTGATVTSSLITRADGSKAIRLDISGNASTDAADLRVFQAVTHTFDIGDSFEFAADVKISGAGGVGVPTGLNGWALIAANAVAFTQSQAANLGGMNFYVDNTVRAAPRPNGAGGSSFTAGIYARFAIGPVAARIEFALPHVAEFI